MRSDPLESIRLSAVIACYRDGPAIPVMHERLTKTFCGLGVDYEIIFVNDCSPDNAREVLESLCDEDDHVRAVHHSRNFGSQSAFTSGMRIASGDAVVLLDGDLQDPPELIRDFFVKWREGYDIVYGERVDREAPIFMRAAYKAFYRLFRRLSYVHIPLDAGDFSLLDRRVVDLLNGLPERNRFMRGLRAWVGFRQTGVPYRRPERLFGRTTNSLLKNFGWARRALVSFSFAPLDFITLVGLIVTVFAFIAIGLQVILRFLFPEMVPSGFSTLIILILFMGGVQLLSLSIIGAYLAHIYDEVKQRPSYIVDAVSGEERPRNAEKSAS